MFGVKISLKRVQTFLFDVPRLRSMIGANALLGETLRLELTKLRCQDKFPRPEGVPGLPPAIANDPLARSVASRSDENRAPLGDDPQALAERGVLARDGGHFTALFDERVHAEKFAAAAVALLSEELPGLPVEWSIQDLNVPDRPENEPDQAERESRPAPVENPINLPFLQVCEATGRGIAAVEDLTPGRNADPNERPLWIAASVKRRLDAGKRFYDGGTSEILGLLKPLLTHGDADWPREITHVSDRGYIALIVADGNSVGNRYTKWKRVVREKRKEGRGEDAELTRLEGEVIGEPFFHSMRVAVRRAFVDAVATTLTFHGVTRDGKNAKFLPFMPLMLGGDDLVMVCAPTLALPFLRDYADRLRDLRLADDEPLTIGAGVAIAKENLPFHRLHHVAESLAGSAKRLSRQSPDRSVVDWQICTQSWFEEAADMRRESDLVRYRTRAGTETLVLSARPYPLLPTTDTAAPGLDSVAGLLGAVEKVQGALNGEDGSRAARSQLRSLRVAAVTGRLAADLTFRQLPKGTRQALHSAGIDAFWEEAIERSEERFYLTRLLDLIDLVEIERLGRKS